MRQGPENPSGASFGPVSETGRRPRQAVKKGRRRGRPAGRPSGAPRNRDTSGRGRGLPQWGCPTAAEEGAHKVTLYGCDPYGDRESLQGGKAGDPKPEPRARDLSRSRTPGPYAAEIIRNVQFYRRYRDEAYLEVAETYARLARAAFCDDACPLPKAFAGASPRTTRGEPFPDFYFRGAKLMHAFALVAEARREEAPGR